MRREDFEIMAPVGSREALAAAMAAGADAIYFGVGDLNMRSRSAANFTLDDLEEIARTCSQNGLKSYLTVNTELFDDEEEKLDALLARAREAGVSAIIAADLGVIMRARELGIEVHISTQANITNTRALEFYAGYADVMVLAREMTLERVSEIHRRIGERNIKGPNGQPVRLEMFCHGALCMAVSGKCYLSLHEMNSSANRGRCNQICRRGYRLTDIETGAELEVDNKYIMSPKDLKTIHFLDRMVEAGVRVFKIEGRARGPEYVRETVECYSQALEAICRGDYGPERIAEWERRLEKVFNRGFWDGYYLGQRLGEWSAKYGSSATRTKEYIASATRWYPKLGVGEFQMKSGELKVGDEVVLTGEKTGALVFRAEELRLEVDPVPEVRKGDLFAMPVPERIRPGDRLYLWKAKN